MKDIFKLLREINKNSGINQRALSSKCNMSLGKVNASIENLEFNNYITKEIYGRQHKYSITKKGLELLERELKTNKDMQLELHTDIRTNVKCAVILAAGRNKNFDIPVSNLKVNEETLIERNISLLKKNGIENIIVIAGYKSELIKDILFNHDITILKNENYKWTGTMESLSIAFDYIEDDFLLVESDIVVEESGISEIINYPSRDCILITTESGSGDEAFVEIRDNKIYKISKDIAQLNRIDGEMIGISKISYEFYKKMIDSYEDNMNPYMNYEYMMLDISRTYSLGYAKVDNLLWHEIDNIEHYNYVTNKLLKRIVKKEESALLSNLKEIISSCMNINIDDIKDISPIGGMTNKNYKICVKDNFYVLRVPGNGTEEMISRSDEIKNAVYANKVGVDAELIYFNEDSGIKISKFIENAETLSPDAAKKQHNMELVSGVLRKLHNSTEVMNNNFDIYGKIEKYEELAKEANGKFFDDYYEVKEKVVYLSKVMNELDVELRPCHNDTIAENFIKSDNNRIYLIDWEYAGMNDPMWDLAAHCLENSFTEEEEELFLKLYFNGKVEEKYKKRVLINKIYQDFLWSTWTNIKEAKGDDFGTYGIDRYNRAKANIEIILGEEV
ncbi:phosphotransferase [Clostridium disporicum]|uniref:Choline kinase n=1 Tax=Clostridium disporicum TaxID=84024 RepID=A0A174F373_9CLOT|nr:phosphotransferase [Clostridium disporicum]CUO43378.1 choline kinase [Clostridium disporicum]